MSSPGDTWEVFRWTDDEAGEVVVTRLHRELAPAEFRRGSVFMDFARIVGGDRIHPICTDFTGLLPDSKECRDDVIKALLKHA